VRLGLNLGYRGSGDGSSPADALALALEAERLGFSVVWVAEAYGSDAPTVLAWLAAQTSRIDVGSAVMQIPARTPAMTAMTAATLDTLSQGRFRLGLGVSGPQVSEGWHGVRFDSPLGRTREYVDVVRLALSRQPVDYQGRHHVLPLPDGPGKALRLGVVPVRDRLPVYLASLGPRNLELTGELADGWLGLFVSAEHVGDSLQRLRAGQATAGATGRDGLDGFDVCVTSPLVVTPDGTDADVVAAAADPVRGYAALYLGGMGSRSQNFYHALAGRMGFEEAADQVQDAYLDRRPRDAASAVPVEFIDATSLLGPVARVAERMAALADAGVTTVNVVPFAPDLPGRVAMLRSAAQALEASGRAA